MLLLLFLLYLGWALIELFNASELFLDDRSGDRSSASDAAAAAAAPEKEKDKDGGCQDRGWVGADLGECAVQEILDQYLDARRNRNMSIESIPGAVFNVNGGQKSNQY